MILYGVANLFCLASVHCGNSSDDKPNAEQQEEDIEENDDLSSDAGPGPRPRPDRGPTDAGPLPANDAAPPSTPPVDPPAPFDVRIKADVESTLRMPQCLQKIEDLVPSTSKRKPTAHFTKSAVPSHTGWSLVEFSNVPPDGAQTLIDQMCQGVPAAKDIYLVKGNSSYFWKSVTDKGDGTGESAPVLSAKYLVDPFVQHALQVATNLSYSPTKVAAPLPYQLGTVVFGGSKAAEVQQHLWDYVTNVRCGFVLRIATLTIHKIHTDGTEEKIGECKLP